MEQEDLCNFGRVYYKKYFCEINLNLDQRLGKCCLKIFLFLALPAILMGGAERLLQFKVEGNIRICM